MMGLVPLEEETQRACFLSAIWGHSEMGAVYKIGRGLSLEPDQAKTNLKVLPA